MGLNAQVRRARRDIARADERLAVPGLSPRLKAKLTFDHATAQVALAKAEARRLKLKAAVG